MKLGHLFSEEWEECKAKMPSLAVKCILPGAIGEYWRASWSPNATRFEQAEAFTEGELLDKVRFQLAVHDFPSSKTAINSLQQWYSAQQKSYLEQQQGLNQHRPTPSESANPKKKNTKPKPPENPYRRKFG